MVIKTKPLWKNRRGQIILPSIILLPALFMFVVLIVEAGRLSRDKIRQQFALDTASALEMEQYTDTLNRLAYINGSFPDRIFREIYGGSWKSYYGAGLYPAAPNGVNPSDPVWPIGFGGGRAWANVPDPPANFGWLHMNPGGGGGLVTLEQAQQAAVGYITAYTWLGDVAAAQKTVFEHMVLDSNHPLLRKSLWMNLPENSGPGSCPEDINSCGLEPAKAFERMRIRTHVLAGFKYCKVVIKVGQQVYYGVMKGAFNFSIAGLWQLSTVPQDDLAMLKEGFVVKHHWTPPKNYFNVSTDAEWPQPYVRTHVLTRDGSVWPNPTPKYYTRLYP